MEIQVNGGSVQDKINWAFSHLENTSEFQMSSVKEISLMLLESPRVMDLKELPLDMELEDFPEKPIKVLEKSVVSEDGIQKESDGLLPELVKTDITIELKPIKEFTESENPPEKSVIMPLLIMMLLKKISLLWEVSLTMERLEMTMLC